MALGSYFFGDNGYYLVDDNYFVAAGRLSLFVRCYRKRRQTSKLCEKCPYKQCAAENCLLFFEWARQLATEFVIITLLIPLLPDKIAADVGDK
jgi:hypothetical protein